jgi:hypothetical protein
LRSLYSSISPSYFDMTSFIILFCLTENSIDFLYDSIISRISCRNACIVLSRSRLDLSTTPVEGLSYL